MLILLFFSLFKKLSQAIHIYDASTGTKSTTIQRDAPVLDATFQDDASTIYSGGLDHAVVHTDVTTLQSTTLGTHDAAVKCVEWIPSLRLVASAGWDSTLRLFDPRTPPNPTPSPLPPIPLPGKAFSMSQSQDRLVVATSGRRVHIYELSSLTRPTPAPEQDRESSLKYQTRCVRCYPDNQGYAISSIEGRVGMDYFDLSDQVQSKKYAFKCHRRQEEGKDVIYPVNALAFNTKYGTFATGGCDGVISMWDGQHKKRLAQVTGYPTSIAALAFNFNDHAPVLAVAASYTYERGEMEPRPADAVYIRPVADAEIQPRLKGK